MLKTIKEGLPWCQVLMDKMDENGDGMLQEEEFCMFLGAAVMRERLEGSEDKQNETREANEDEQKKLKGILDVLNCVLPMLN